MTTAMDTTSFSSRRQAATSLPQFHLPTPANVPRVTSDGLSPLSNTHTGSSQASGPGPGLSGYYGHSHGSWPTPGTSNSSYTFGSTNQQGQSISQPGYTRVYGQSAPLPYGSRNPQSPTAGIDGMPHASYDQTHQPYSTAPSGSADAGGGSNLGSAGGGLGMGPGTGSHGGSGGAGGGGGVLPGIPGGSSLSGAASAPPGLHRHSQSSQGSILGSQTPTNAQPPSTASPGAGPGAIDPYSQSRSPPSQSYYTPVSASSTSAFQSYASPPQGSSAHPPVSSTGAPRPLGSMIPPSGMAPPQSYRGYPQYSHMPHMGGPIMSNMGNPGGHMSLVTGMNMHPGYGQMTHRMYGGQQPQQERPFSCDQCTQSFNRNHDLKRHKRIHLAVKPFPCSSCDKSFSRKDALKRHRLVKGCDTEANKDNSKSRQNQNDSSRPHGGDNMTDPTFNPNRDLTR